MNAIRPAALLLTLSLAGSASAETVIDQLYSARNYDLADAYWSAGQRFTDLGQADRGAEFQAKAKKLFPGFVPGQKPTVNATVTAAAAPAPAPQVPAPEVVREKNLQGEKIAQLQFQKLFRGVLTGSKATIASVVGPTLSVQGEVADPAAFAELLSSQTTEAATPADLFDLDSLQVVDGSGTQVLVKVKTAAGAPQDLAAVLASWKEDQTYTFSRVGETWKLTAVEGR